MNCRDFRTSMDRGSASKEGMSHMAGCRRCREVWELTTIRRALLDASRSADEIQEPSATFYYALNRRLREMAPGGGKDQWLPTIRFARSFVSAAIVILVIITGLNLYVVRKSSSAIIRMDSYWRDASGDGEAMVLSDEAITHDLVLKSLVAMRGRHGE